MTIYEMTEYLHAVNKFTYKEQCDFIDTTALLDGWLDAENSTKLDVSLGLERPTIVYAQMLPIRSCNNISLTYNGTFSPCVEGYSEDCGSNMTVEELEDILDLRRGSLVEVTQQDGEIFTSVVYNLSSSVSMA